MSEQPKRPPKPNLEEFERFKAEMRRRAPFASFEGLIKELERVCQNTPGVRFGRSHEPEPSELSRAWYAEKILLSIWLVRDYLKHGQAVYAASEAVTIGVWAAEAEARHNWKEVQSWLKFCDRSREAARKRGRELSEAAESLQRDVESAAKEYRAQNLYDRRTNSTRRMAVRIARKLGKNENTIRHRLKKLGIR